MHWALVAAILAALSGCATTGGGGATQVVSVSASTATGEAVPGLECILRNDKGEWRLTSPGSAEVLRSKQPLLVGCASEQWQPTAADPGAMHSSAAPVKSMAIGAAIARTVASATTIGATGCAAMAAVPLFTIGALVGGAMGWGHSTTDAAHACSLAAASTSGDLDVRRVAVGNRGEMAAAMTASQVADNERRVREWMPKWSPAL